jgi:hypothetical protein
MRMISVYNGQRCMGFVLARGKRGYEAFDTDEKSLGIFPTMQAAADAVSAAA